MLTFGMVSIPVGVGSATATTNDPSFKVLHEKCRTPVSLKTVEAAAKKEPAGEATATKMWCVTCHTEVDETVKGFEYAKGEFVYFTAEELEALAPGRSPVIRLSKFVKATEIRPVMIDKHYFLIPNRHQDEGYGLLYQALAATKEAGLGTQTLWGKEHPCAVVASQDYPEGGVLMMQTLKIAEDLVVPDFSAPIPSRELKKLAKELVLASTGSLNPEVDLESASRQTLHAAITTKIEGKELSFPSNEEAVAAVPDIQEALRREIANRTREKVK
jgi:DNA end-binding protein Ku